MSEVDDDLEEKVKEAGRLWTELFAQEDNGNETPDWERLRGLPGAQEEYFCFRSL